MGQRPRQNTISNPRLFRQSPVISAIRSRQQSAWSSQPLWKMKNGQFTKEDKTGRRKLITALVQSNNSAKLIQHGYELYMCSSDFRCGSPLCNFCRTHIQDRIEQRVLRYFGSSRRNDIYFLTVLDDLIYNPVVDAQAQQQYLKRKIKRVFENHQTLSNTRMFGGFELDVKNTAQALNAQKALETLKHYGLDPTRPVAYMPHFHAIVDLNGHSIAACEQALRQKFTKPYQISLSEMHTGNTKAYHLGRLARYMFKFRYQFADNIMRAKPAYGKWFDDQTLCPYAEALLSMTTGKRGARSFELMFNL